MPVQPIDCDSESEYALLLLTFPSTIISNAMEHPKLFVLPKDTSPATRIVTLSNPRTSAPSRYLFCPEKGFYQFTKIAAPRATPRSWLLARTSSAVAPLKTGTVPSAVDDESVAESIGSEECGKDGVFSKADRSTGYMTMSSDLFVATPMDPLFLLLPALMPASTAKKPKQLFLSSDDYFERLAETSKHFGEIIQTVHCHKLLESRMAAVCDKVEAGDEAMFRLKESKLVNELIRKAEGVLEFGLPASLEEKFVKRALEAPVTALDCDPNFSADIDASDAAGSKESIYGVQTPPSTCTNSIPSLSAASSTASSLPQSTAATTPSLSTPQPASAPEPIIRLLRLRTVLSYLIANYLPPHIRSTLNLLLSGPLSPIDFKPLEKHLSELSALRQEALASRSLSDFSRKRSLEDDDAADARAEKKRKSEEEEKRKKAGESRGVRDLKKADTTGMKRLSDFFGGKKPGTMKN